MKHHEAKELIVHIPDVDPVRRRWFIVSVAVTSVCVLLGWGYFFRQQVVALARSVPQTFAGDALDQAVREAKQLGSDTADGLKTQVVTAPAVAEVQAQIHGVIEVGKVVDLMTDALRE